MGDGNDHEDDDKPPKNGNGYKDDKDGFPVWAIVLIVVSFVVLVGILLLVAWRIRKPVNVDEWVEMVPLDDIVGSRRVEITE